MKSIKRAVKLTILCIVIVFVSVNIISNNSNAKGCADSILGCTGPNDDKPDGDKGEDKDGEKDGDKGGEKVDTSKDYNDEDLGVDKSRKFLENPDDKVSPGYANGINSSKKAVFYWNRKNIIASHNIVQVLDIDSCDKINGLNYGQIKTKFNNRADKFNNYLVSCVVDKVGNGLSQDFSDYKSKSKGMIYLKNQIISPNKEAKIYCSFKKVKHDMGESNLGIPNDVTVSQTLDYEPKCTVSFFSEKITEFWPVNFNNGEMIYYTDNVHQFKDDYSADIRYHNGVITNINMSRGGKIDLTFKGMSHDSSANIIGDPAKSWQENFFYDKTNKQYGSLLKKYQKICQKNSSTPSDCTGENGKETFSHIWMKCVVATGSPDEDVINANTCLKNNAGVGLDDKKISKDKPVDEDVIEQKNSCNVKSGGFLICPLIGFFSSVADNIFQMINPMLQIKPIEYNPMSPDDISKLSATEKNKAKGGIIAYQAWRIFTSIANAVFVIFFLVIIFSQITNIGISNYGIKKLLPKIIIGAILLNISFFICSLLIDLSNIAGNSLKGLLDSINDTAIKNATFTTNFSSDGGSHWSEIGDNLLLVSGGGLGVVAGGVAMYYAFLPIVLSVVFAIIAFIIFLFIRYSLVVVLILISPLAFICYILPNTKKWFTKWYTTYIGLLMIYPVVSVIFGMSTLAANIIASSADTDNSQSLMMFALSVQAIPLVIVPFITKKIQQVTGDMGTSKIGGKIKKFAGGLAKRRQERWNNKSRAAALRGNRFIPGARAIRLGAKLKKADSYRQRSQSRANQEYLKNVANDDRKTMFGLGKSTKGEKFSKKVLGSSDGAQAHFRNYVADAVVDEDFRNNIKVKRKKLKDSGIDEAEEIKNRVGSMLNNDLADPDTEAEILAGLEALIDKINEGNDSESIDALEELMKHNNFTNLSEKSRMYLAEKVAASNNPLLGVEAARNIRHKKKNLDFNADVILPGLENLSAHDLAGMSGEHLERLKVALGSANQGLRDSISEIAQEALRNPKVRSSFRDSETEAKLKELIP